ncbi:MAG: hypothetical protein JXR76_13970 [Deltaproteobacteria bacterium]|nr:hypothetical protein [Deltaproteobacteria bacterium]
MSGTALLISSMVIGAAAGMSLGDIIKAITVGMGDTLAEVALIVALGTVFGRKLEASRGGATIWAETLLGRFGASKSRSAMAVAGYITKIPVFFNAGRVLLAPAIYGLKNKPNKSIMFFALPLLAGLVATHTFVPPTPGPIAAAEILGADLRWVILFGAIAAIPATYIGGSLFGRFIHGRAPGQIPKGFDTESPHLSVGIESRTRRSGAGAVIGLIGLPIGLMLMGCLDSMAPQGSETTRLLSFAGHPICALLICTLSSLYFPENRPGMSGGRIRDVCNGALESAGMIILILL